MYMFRFFILMVSIIFMGYAGLGLSDGGAFDVFGADSCDGDCHDDSFVINECAHNSLQRPTPPNDCEDDRCLKNIVFKATCTPIAEGSDCM